MNGNPQASNRKPIFNIGLAGEAGFLLTFREQPSPALTDYILRIAEHLSAQYGALIIDVAPAYKTLAIFYDARHPNALALHTHLIAMGRENAAEQSRNTGPPETEQTPAHNRPLDTVTALSTRPQQHIALPVYYDVEVAPDLRRLRRMLHCPSSKLLPYIRSKPIPRMPMVLRLDFVISATLTKR